MLDKPISPLRQRMIDDMTARQIQGEGAERLRPARQDLRGLTRPFAGHGHERGSSPISIAFGQAADQPRVHQRRDRRRPKPSYRARKSITLLVSVNSDLPDRVHSLPTSYPVGSC